MKKGLVAKLFLLFILLTAADQFSKYLIRSSGGFYICNKNIAFGIEPKPFIFWIILALIFFAFLCIFLNPNIKISITKKIPSVKSKGFILFIWDFIGNLLRRQAGWDLEIGNLKSPLIATVLIISGAISNIIDRLYLGCIIDFIDLKFWPVFNLADVFIISGAILLLAKYLKSYYNGEKGR